MIKCDLSSRLLRTFFIFALASSRAYSVYHNVNRERGFVRRTAHSNDFIFDAELMTGCKFV